MARTYLGYTQIAANADLDALWNGERGLVVSANNYGFATTATGAVNRAAFIAAYTAAQALGGGRIIADPGTYQIAGYETHEVMVPVATATYQPELQALGAHFYALEPTGLHFDMPGVTLQSQETGFNFFLFDGARDCTFNIGRVLTPSAYDGSSTLSPQGLNVYAFTSTTRESWGIRIPYLYADHCNVSLYVFGDPASAFRVHGITIGTIRHTVGTYGIALHDNGDDVFVGNLITHTVGRPVFAYGVSRVRGNVHNLSSMGGLSFLLKAYDRDLTDIDLQYSVVQLNTSVPAVGLESEHNVAAQPTPCSLRNVAVDYDDTGSSASGVGFRIRYLVDGVSTPTVATTLFDGLTLSGTMDGTDQPTVDVLQTPSGLLNIDNLLLDGAPLGRAMFSAGGFYGLYGATKNFAAADRGFGWEPSTSGATTQYGETMDHTASVAATSLVVGRYIRSRTAAGVFTTALVHLERVAAFIKGAGSTATKVVGTFFEAQTEGTTNFAFETNNPAIMQGCQFFFVTGTPEGVTTAPVGSIAVRNGDGTTGTLIYRKDSGTGNTGWVAKL